MKRYGFSGSSITLSKESCKYSKLNLKDTVCHAITFLCFSMYDCDMWLIAIASQRLSSQYIIVF